MQLKAFYDGGFSSVCYLVADDAWENAVVIDPSLPPKSTLWRLSAVARIHAILLTHGHFDHMLALSAWKNETSAPICICREDAAALSDPHLNCSSFFLGEGVRYPSADRLLDEGEEILFGNERLTVMKTPGHTPGSCLYLGKDVIFTGDTMMADGSYGRYDLPGGSASLLYRSLSRIAALERDACLYPGHGRSTTLREEKNIIFSK